MESKTQEKKLFTITDAANYLGIGRSATYRLVWGNRLRHIRQGKRIYVPRQELDEFMTRELEGIQ